MHFFLFSFFLPPALSAVLTVGPNVLHLPSNQVSESISIYMNNSMYCMYICVCVQVQCSSLFTKQAMTEIGMVFSGKWSEL